MLFSRLSRACATTLVLGVLSFSAQSQSQSSKRVQQPDSVLDAGTVTNNLYRNKMLGLTCKIPDAWVLRTDELNAPAAEENEKPADANAPGPSAGARVLLAAFSRPPQAKGEEINSSILIAAEPAASYPGLKEAAQYFDPLTEVAKAQGFTLDEEPYETAMGTKTLVRADFHKDVGTRVMRQSTLAMLSHGYAVSITVIAGTEDEVEELIDGLTFASAGK